MVKRRAFPSFEGEDTPDAEDSVAIGPLPPAPAQAEQLCHPLFWSILLNVVCANATPLIRANPAMTAASRAIRPIPFRICFCCRIFLYFSRGNLPRLETERPGRLGTPQADSVWDSLRVKR